MIPETSPLRRGRSETTGFTTVVLVKLRSVLYQGGWSGMVSRSINWPRIRAYVHTHMYIFFFLRKNTNTETEGYSIGTWWWWWWWWCWSWWWRRWWWWWWWWWFSDVTSTTYIDHVRKNCMGSLGSLPSSRLSTRTSARAKFRPHRMSARQGPRPQILWGSTTKARCGTVPIHYIHIILYHIYMYI